MSIKPGDVFTNHNLKESRTYLYVEVAGEHRLLSMHEGYIKFRFNQLSELIQFIRDGNIKHIEKSKCVV